jgi:hypothetical protein
LYATQFIDTIVDHPDASYPLPPPLATTRNVDFSERNEPLASFYALQRAERRDLLVFSSGRMDLEVRVTASGIEVTNRTGRDISDAYALVGDETYYIPVLQTGANTYSSLTRSPLLEERSTIVRALLSWLPLRQGQVWLLVIDQDAESVFEDDGIYQKVRHVTVSLVEGAPQ